MADEPITETVQPEPTKASETPATIDPAEFAKVQAALKEANREAATRRKQLEAYEKAEADRKAAEMTEAERLSAQLKAIETENAQLKRAQLVARIAAKAGLPAELAERLQGNTEEELAADAEKLKAFSKPTNPSLSPTNPGNAQRTESPAEKRERLLGQKADIWKGGGINWPDNS